VNDPVLLTILGVSIVAITMALRVEIQRRRGTFQARREGWYTIVGLATVAVMVVWLSGIDPV
jgi:hypothetical protein